MTSELAIDAIVDYSPVHFEADLRWWKAANYLTAAQIYLQDNVLMREPLRVEHIKPRLLGHWGTCPGLSLIYVLINRHIRETDTDWLYVTGPGHGGPALIAANYLDGTYSEIYPSISLDADGVRRLCRQFSTPGGVPSHVSVQTPGSIHEGGELGYALLHAAGAAFDNPDLIVACVIGDGEAETGPMSASWKLPAFLNPVRDGAVLPFLHVNGAKISGPTVSGRSTDSDLTAWLSGQGWDAMIVDGDEPELVIQDLYLAIAEAHRRIRLIQRRTRSGSPSTGLRWPAIVLRTPKGWTGPHRVDGTLIEGTHRAHQVPLSAVRENPAHRAQLEQWLRSYRPEEVFTEAGGVVESLRRLAPSGDKRLGATPYANGGRLLQRLAIRPVENYALDIASPGHTMHETTRVLGEMMRDLYADNMTDDAGGNFRLFCPDETASNRLAAVFDVTARCWQLPVTIDDDDLAPDGRVMEVLSEHMCQGWLEGYLLSGRHGLFATYEAFAMVSVSMLIQHVKWLQHARDLAWRADVASMNVLLTSTCWRNDHNGFSHQGPGLVDAVLPLAPGVVQVWFPPDANTLLAVAERVFVEVNRVNVIVVDKQSHPQFLNLPTARAEVAAGASIWHWAGTEHDRPADAPVDIVLACAGDVPTEETLAAAAILRMWAPGLTVRVVNVINLLALLPPSLHPDGVPDDTFDRLFTTSVDVVFAFHGYPRAVHQLLHGRKDPGRFHVRGFTEQGTTTTPFDMVVLNGMSRFHLVMEVLRRTNADVDCRNELIEHCAEQLAAHTVYIREHFEDMPEIRDWRWS